MLAEAVLGFRFEIALHIGLRLRTEFVAEVRVEAAHLTHWIAVGHHESGIGIDLMQRVEI
jgi:hypothetical protein